MTYFSDRELACRCCGEMTLADGFREKLVELREAVGHPMAVTSCCRCERHNKRVGGKSSSFHLTTHSWGCCAADIRTDGWDGVKKHNFVREAMNRGWSVGINWSKGFVHIDGRSWYPEADWPHPVLFPY